MQNTGKKTIQFGSCSKHAGEQIKFYCGDHDVIGCGDCVVLSHRKCRDICVLSGLLNVESVIPSSKSTRLIELLNATHKAGTAETNTADAGPPLDRYDAYLLEKALLQEKGKDKCLRINVVGYHAQGKTALTRRLLNQSLDNIESTDGIDVHVKKCKIEGEKWESFQTERADEECIMHLAEIIKSDAVKKGEEVTITSGDNVDQSDTESSNAMFTQTIYRRTQMQEVSKPNQDNYRITSRVSKLLRETKEEKTENQLVANIWDFGGQFVYYATHQIFHSADAIYLLVFDLSKDLEVNIIDCDFPERKEKMKNCLKFWVDSIDAFVGSVDCTKPTVILVGTHKDKFNGDVEKKFEEVIDIFSEAEARGHIHEKHFAVDNTDFSDPVFDQLRKTVYEIGKANIEKQMIPAKWIPLEMALLATSEKNILTFDEVLHLDATNSHPIRDVDEIKLFLKYHHAKGTLVFFDEENLSKFIVVNPSYLIGAFRYIIASKRFCKWKKDLHPLWKKLTTTAVLTFELVHEVWRNSDFGKDSDILLKFLQKHRIMSELLVMDETGTIKHQKEYLIPSLLKQSCNEECLKMFMGKKQCTTVLIGFRLEKSTVLLSVYERLTAAALGMWPAVKFQCNLMVFRNTGFYRLDQQHVGQIILKLGKGIEISVINQCVNQCVPNKVNARVCDRFRRYIESVIAYEFGKLGRESRKDPYIYYCACNHPEHRLGRGSEDTYEFEEIVGSDPISCPDNMDHSIDPKQARQEWFLIENIFEKSEIPDRTLTEKDLGEVAESLGENWELLGARLGVTSVEIQRLKMDHGTSGIVTAIFHMLLTWKQKNLGNDTLLILMHAMKDCEQLVVNWDKVRNILDTF